MQKLNVHIDVSSELYLRNPDSSELGKRIIKTSIDLIYDIGFEMFTFKKLGEQIGSPESSIYRYFENKQSLLIYLVAWYWSWVDYKLVFAITNITSPQEKLKRAINVLVQPVLIDNSILHVNEVLLSEIINSESVKTYHTKEVDNQNKKGCFSQYKYVVHRVSDIVLEVEPTFEYPHMLISTIIEGAHQQRYFAEHLPSLTDTKQNHDAVGDFYQEMVFKVLK
jgi:AcrR family transcriptional regulator